MDGVKETDVVLPNRTLYKAYNAGNRNKYKFKRGLITIKDIEKLGLNAVLLTGVPLDELGKTYPIVVLDIDGKDLPSITDIFTTDNFLAKNEVLTTPSGGYHIVFELCDENGDPSTDIDALHDFQGQYKLYDNEGKPMNITDKGVLYKYPQIKGLDFRGLGGVVYRGSWTEQFYDPDKEKWTPLGSYSLVKGCGERQRITPDVFRQLVSDLIGISFNELRGNKVNKVSINMTSEFGHETKEILKNEIKRDTLQYIRTQNKKDELEMVLVKWFITKFEPNTTWYEAAVAMISWFKYNGFPENLTRGLIGNNKIIVAKKKQMGGFDLIDYIYNRIQHKSMAFSDYFAVNYPAVYKVMYLYAEAKNFN